MQRFPKLRGFHSHRAAVETVYTGQINAVSSAKVDNHALSEAGLVSSPHTNVKLVVKGEVTKKISVHLQKASQSAVKAVEKAGGSFTPTAQVPRPSKKTADKTEHTK